MTDRLFAAALLAVLLPAATAFAAPPRALAADHPIVGQWLMTTPGSGCRETFDIHADGTATVTSGDEVAQIAFDIGDQPDANGVYRWVDKVVGTNAKRDCGDSLTPVGNTETHYLRFDASGRRIAICQDPAARLCIGPYVRLPAKAGGGTTKL